MIEGLAWSAAYARSGMSTVNGNDRFLLATAIRTLGIVWVPYAGSHVSNCKKGSYQSSAALIIRIPKEGQQQSRITAKNLLDRLAVDDNHEYSDSSRQT